jgi:RNA polymerase sigma factor (sigma-70 family)
MTPTAARLARLLSPPHDARPDGALLAAFLADRDEAAFAELVRRHGPVVWAACRRLLPDPADAEDAFQSSFLVLVRRARQLTGSATLGPWLYRVAAWTARNVRRRNARRLARTAALRDAVPAPATSPAVTLDLDAALLALPEKYRTPLVLCHLQGWSRRGAAAQLGCPEGTLSALLARGLVRLRAKLGAHDPAALLAVGLTAVPAGLATATVTAVRAATAGVIPVPVADLVEGVLRMFWVKKATAAAVGLAAVFALGAGAGLSVRDAPGVTAAQPTPAALPVAPPPKAAPEPDDIRAMRERREKLTDLRRTLEHQLSAHRASLGLARAELARATRILEALADGNPAEQQAARAAVTLARNQIAFGEQAVARDEGLVRRVVGEIPRADQELSARLAAHGAEVSGRLAVEVTFPTPERYKLALAAVELARRATWSGAVPPATWDTALRGCYVLVQLPRRPQRIPVQGAPDLMIAELLVPLPLTRAPGGFVLARSGDRVVRFTKYPHDTCVRFQETLAAATPAGR